MSGVAGSFSHRPISPRHSHIAPWSPTAKMRLGVGQATARSRGCSTCSPGPNRLSGSQPAPGLKRATAPWSPTATASLESAPTGAPGCGATASRGWRNGAGQGFTRDATGSVVRCTGIPSAPSHPSRGELNAAPSWAPGNRLASGPAPSASTRMKAAPSRRRLTPSVRPVITRAPNCPSDSAALHAALLSDLLQAMLRSNGPGRASGSSCWHAGAPSAPAGSRHQLASTWPPCSPSGLKKIVVDAGVRVWTSPRSPSIQTPSLVTVKTWEMTVGGSPRPATVNGSGAPPPCTGTVSGSASSPVPPAAATGFQTHLACSPSPSRTRRKSATAPVG